MKRILSEQRFLVLLRASVLIILAVPATAADFAIDASDPNNGLFDIYSATFDPPLTPDPGETFFLGGTPPASRAIVIAPTPTTVVVVADTTLCKQDFVDPQEVPPCPNGTLYPTATPSALNLTLSAGNTQLAINGGDVFFPNLALVINGGLALETNIFAEGASMISFAPSPGTVPVDVNGVAVIEIELNPLTAVDFATFTEIVTSCTGPLCALVGVLTLDMQRYRLTIDWDPTFSFFTADFIGQTSNNSMVFATLDSVVATPDITVTDSVTPANDLSVPFGGVAVGGSMDETVTVTNDGTANLVLGAMTQPASPFSVIDSNSCSGKTLAPAASCVLTVRLAPASPGTFNSDFNIPSNDPDENPVTVVVSGTGTGVPDITVTDSVAPATDLQVPFGDVTEGLSMDETVTVTNDGTANLVLGTITQPVAPFSVIDNNSCAGKTLTPATSCVLTVRFAPAAPGTFNSSFNIGSNDPDENPVTVGVSGTGTAIPVPDITVTDSAPPVDDLDIAFGSVTEATTTDHTVTVTNDGTANLVLGQIALSNPLAAPFSIVNDPCSNQTLTSAASCILTVRFAPTASGPFNDVFDIPSNDPDETSVLVTVNGTGTVALIPDIAVTDSVAPVADLLVPFGNVTEGTASADETVTVTNNGTADLVLGQIAIGNPLAAPFIILNNLCSGQTLTPAASCTLMVNFAPAAIGTFNDSFDIPSDDPDENPVTVNVSGAGTAIPVPDITVIDSAPPLADLQIPFGNVTAAASADHTVTITNDGTGDLTLGQIALGGMLAPPFSTLNDTCSNQTLIPAANCTLTVRFAPTATGPFSDSFDIPSDDPDENLVVMAVSGTGTPTPVPNIAVTDSVAPVTDLQIPFGMVTEGASAVETVTINNNGSTDLLLGQIAQANALAAPFSIPALNDNCSGQTILPAGNCTVEVRFAPATDGTFNDSFDIPSNDPDDNPVTMSISGTGTPTPVPDISVTDQIPPQDDLMMPFGDVVENTAWVRPVTITNVGTANLTIGMIAAATTLADPFSILTDTCSGQTLVPEASCTVEVQFLPDSVALFSDSFDISSDDPDEPVLIFSVSGNGVVVGTGVIDLAPSGADSGFFGSAINPGTLLALFLLVAANLRRRYR